MGGLVWEMTNNSAGSECIAMIRDDSDSQDEQLQDANPVCKVRTLIKDKERTSTNSTILPPKCCEKVMFLGGFS